MRRPRLLAVAMAIVAGWLALGVLRAGPSARDAFAHLHGAGVTVADVTIDGQVPLPPFWVVSVGGDVVEAGQTSPSYRSYMILLVEPITGFGMTVAAG